MKITKISVQRTGKDGEPFISTYTKHEQAKVSIQVDDPTYAGKWISSFVELGDPIEKWQVGDEANVLITQKGNFLNFKVSRQGGGRNGATELNNANGQIIEKLFTKFNLMQAEIEKIGGMIAKMTKAEEFPALTEEKPEDVPF